MKKRHNRTVSQEPMLQKIIRNKNREALCENNDYDTSTPSLLAPTDRKQSLASSEELATNSTVASIQSTDVLPVDLGQKELIEDTRYEEIKPSEVGLVKKATDENIYELKTKFKLNKRRFSNEGTPKSNLTDVKFANVQSILDQSGSFPNNEFAGIFNLFWVAVAVIVINVMVNYYLEHGWRAEIVDILANRLVEVGLTDLWMYLSIYPVLWLHQAIKAKYLSWEKSGWIISSIYEFAFVVNFTLFAEKQNFPWIGKIFLFLHSLVLLMKAHSYSFYNGYLWRIKKELKDSQDLLKKIDDDPTYEESKKLLTSSIEFCEFELKSQSKETPFPENITTSNFFWYTMFPILVYQIDFPRTSRIRWSFVFEKVSAIFGVISIMIVIAQNMMYPVVMRALALKSLPLWDRIYQYPLLLLNVMPSFVIIYLLVFYLIWDAILNAIAELTRFGDRDFYGPWWNCTSWDQFARLWNVPVHKFLLRHVYHSSISALQLSKSQATLMTFLLSSIVHELSMFVVFHKFRGYLLLLQMFQLPLVAISKTKYLNNKKTLGNVIFWVGIITGPSLMCTLYLTF